MIKEPKWAKGAYPTAKGWVRNGELLISRKFSQEEIDAWGSTERAVETTAEVWGTIHTAVIVDELTEDMVNSVVEASKPSANAAVIPAAQNKKSRRKNSK